MTSEPIESGDFTLMSNERRLPDGFDPVHAVELDVSSSGAERRSPEQAAGIEPDPAGELEPAIRPARRSGDRLADRPPHVRDLGSSMTWMLHRTGLASRRRDVIARRSGGYPRLNSGKTPR